MKDDKILLKFLTEWKEKPKCIEYDIEVIPTFFDVWSKSIKSLYPNSCVADIIDLRSNFIATEVGYNVLQGIPKYLKELFVKSLGSSSEIAKTCDETGIFMKNKVIMTVAGHLIENMSKEKAISELISNAIDASLNKDSPLLTSNDGYIIIEDVGMGLKIENLALGQSGSYNNDRASGTFGEGLKLSCYCILKQTKEPIIIETVKYRIKAELKVHKESKSDLLVFTWGALDKLSGTKIIFKGTSEELEKAKEMFLLYNFNYSKKEDGIFLPGGTIFVNGVKSGSYSELFFTYNLVGYGVKNIIDRDRKRITSDDLAHFLLEHLKKIRSKEIFENILFNDCFELKLLYENFDIFCSAFIKDLFKDIIESKYRTTKICLSTPYDSISDRMAEEKGFLVLRNIDSRLRGILLKIGYKTSVNVVLELGGIEYRNVVHNEILFENLTDEEKLVWSNLKNIVVKEYGLLIWKTFHICDAFMDSGLFQTQGAYFPKFNVIFVLRELLNKNKMESLIGVSIHEIIHMKYQVHDCTREFENYLTEKIGKLMNQIYRDSFVWDSKLKVISDYDINKTGSKNYTENGLKENSSIVDEKDKEPFKKSSFFGRLFQIFR